jgi:hypothetical protein
MIAEDNKRFYVTISRKLYKQLQQIAAADNRSVSDYVAKLVIDDIKTKGK